MLSGHRSAWRRRSNKSRAARIAVPLAIPMALGLTLGIIIAVSGGNSTTIAQSALGSCASAAASAPATAASAPAASAPAASASAPTASAPAAASSAAAVPCPSASGSAGATTGATTADFTIPPNGQVQIYNPLVINQGTTPAVAPVAPTIAAGSQVILSLGFNGNALALVGPGAQQGNCIDAFGNSLINQTPQCNAANFYRMANAEIARGTLTVPATGTGKDGQACQTTRDFGLIDQDQSDNVVASYLFNPATGQTAQATAANKATAAAAMIESNGSDNGLLNNFVDVALGCTPFTAPNPTNPNGASGSQALDELSARANQKGTIALLPVNDPQLLVGGQFSIGKTNAYRIETDQRPLFTSAQQKAKVTGTTTGAGAGRGGGGARNRGNFMPGRHGHM